MTLTNKSGSVTTIATVAVTGKDLADFATTKDGCSATGSSLLTVAATDNCLAGWVATGTWTWSGSKALAAMVPA